jgi:hypothetical protein
VPSLLKALDSLPQDQLVYGTDSWWPLTPEQYSKHSLLPHLSAFEAAADLSRQGGGDDPEGRARLRTSVFHDNVMSHWKKATRDVPQDLKPANGAPQTRNTWLGERGK